MHKDHCDAKIKRPHFQQRLQKEIFRQKGHSYKMAFGTKGTVSR